MHNVLKILSLYKKNGNYNRRQREFLLDVNQLFYISLKKSSILERFQIKLGKQIKVPNLVHF
jgi:hypothetical protein